MKHNKRRNTAFLFEAIVKELTKAALKNDHKGKKEATAVLKEFFNKGSILAKELELYKALYETRATKEKEAEKILKEVKRVYSGLNHSSVFQAQSELITKVNKNLNSGVFSNFVPNYKAIASIAQLFGDKTSIKNKVLLERQIVNFMTSTPLKKKEQAKKLNSAELKLFAKHFNNTYESLLKEQKELLSKFVDSFKDNGLELKIFLNEEIGRLREKIKNSFESQEIKNDSEMVEKTKKVLEVIDSFKGQIINGSVLKKVLKIQELANEIYKK